METKTVKELQAIAKQQKLRGYSRLRKAELITLLNEAPQQLWGAVETKDRLLLDEPVPSISIPILQPTPAATHSATRSAKPSFYNRLNNFKVLGTKIKSEVSTFVDWIINYKPEPIKRVMNEKLGALKTTISNLFKETDIDENKRRFDLTSQKSHIVESKTAIKGFAKQYVADGIAGTDAETFLNSAKSEVVNLIGKNRQTKINLVLFCKMERVDIKSGEVTNTVAPFVSKTEVVLEGTDVGELYNNASDKMLKSMAKFQMTGSNWRFRAVSRLEINTATYKPLKGKSWIPLPPELAAKKAVINMKNEDDECFKWCVTRALNPVEKNSERITEELREQAIKLNWNGIEFPVPVDENVINKFEKNNKVSVNVFGYDDNVYPLILSKRESEKVIDLLLISEGERKHYCWIKNFNKLCAERTETGGHNSMHYCKRCLNGYRHIEGLDKHNEYCGLHKAQRAQVPKAGTTKFFKHYFKSMRVPFVVYADFESFIKPIDTCHPNNEESYTNKYQKHTPSSFCYHIKCFDDSLYQQEPVTFTAENETDDVAQIFVDTLEQNIKDIYNQFKFSKKMIFTKKDETLYKSTTTCHICEGAEGEFRRNEIDDDNYIKVRDHCHLTGKFRGAAHNKCNLAYRIPTFYPVLFHNLTGYDSHLFIKKLRSVVDGETITCIPNNEEKYISFSKKIVVDKFTDEKTGNEVDVKRELRFLDSFRFMPSSLDALSKNLKDDQCCEMAEAYGEQSEQFKLLRKKGTYPYDYMDSIERLDETKLPPKDAFYSKLNDSGISDEEYEHAKNVWNEFNCKTMRDYHDLYNKSDVLLLADVFEKFRDVCMKNYKLDPVWYFTSPGLAWDAALKLTKVKLELISDYDMLLMIQQGIRGGVSTISNRFAHANNKYMGESFDNSKPPSYISYLDANNLYGWAMSKPLATDGFKWMSEEELDDWKNISAEEERGCILEVDLEYPKDLHDLHNDYPLASENIMPEGSKVRKLIPNLNNKTKYVLHYENLKQYESLGLIITKIHRGILFDEEAWLKKYIDLNTKLRTEAANDFEKDFFKLMNNSVFGKTIENIENRVDVRLVTSEKEALKLSAKVNYDRCTIFDENLIAVHMRKTKVMYDKPIYLGMSILDLSKTLMYDFHYNYIKNKYDDRAKLLFTDTDSLAYEIKTEDFYADIAGDVERLFDTSDYPKDHPSGIKVGVNKKVIGMFKDEAAGKQIEEFVGLRAKLYSYKMFEGKENKKCKGVKRCVVEKTISHDDYRNTLFNRTDLHRTMNVIRSCKHDIYTEEVNKIALSSDDDKRVIQEDGVHTLAYGHWKLEVLIR